MLPHTTGRHAQQPAHSVAQVGVGTVGLGRAQH